MVKKSDSRDQEGDAFAVPITRQFKRQSTLSRIEELIKGSSSNEAFLEAFFRRVVREELEKKPPLFNASSSGAGPPIRVVSDRELRFYGTLPGILYTGSRIKTEDPPKSNLHVLLFDTRSQSIVATGPLSSMKVEIVALNSKFGSGLDDWTKEQFDCSVVREREGRRPLVAGNLIVSLSKGVGVIESATFTDNSSWQRSGKFRLGVRRVSSGSERVREAITSPFKVKDQRGEVYKKNHPPYLKDEVWRLEKIGKGGPVHKRLTQHQITTVQDLLRLQARDQNFLRQMLGGKKKTWSAVVDHANECVVDDNKLYAYHKHELDVTLFFDSVYRVTRASFAGHFLYPDQFNPSQMVLVDNLKQHAYRSVNELVPVDVTSLVGPDWPILQPHHPAEQICCVPEPAPLICGPYLVNQLAVSSQPYISPQIVFPQNYHTFELGSSSQAPVNFNTENMFSNTWGNQGLGFYFGEECEQHGIFPLISGNGKGKVQWGKIRAAIKCWLSVKDVATRKMSRPVYLSC